MQKYISFIIALFLFVPTFAKNEGTYKSIEKEYTLLPDGGIVTKVSTILTYNTQLAFNSLFGETFVTYNPEYQTLKIDTLYTIQKDGNIISAPDNAFNEVLPAAAAKAPDYNHLKEMVITHTGLEIGATSYLTYTLVTKPRYYPSLDVYDIIGVNGAEIKSYKVTITVPSGTNLRWSLANSNVKPVVKNDSYTWTFTNVQSPMGEANTPYSTADLPSLSATTSQNFERNMLSLGIETREMLNANHILKDADTDAKRADMLHKFFINSLATSRVTPDMNGYRVRQCGRVLQTAYGTEAEKALGMARLMRSAGLEAKAVVAFRASDKVHSMKNVVEFMVLYNNKLYSVNSQNSPVAALRGSRYVVCDLQGNIIETKEIAGNLNTDLTMKLSNDSALISGKVDCTAALIPSLYYSNSPNGESILSNINITNKREEIKGETYTVDIIDGYLTPETKNLSNDADGDKMLIFKLPKSRYGASSWGSNNLNSMRTASYEIPYTVDEKQKYIVELGEGATSLTKNIEKRITNSAGAVTISVKNNENSITIERELKINKPIFSPGEYKQLRALLLIWNNEAHQTVLVKKK